MPDESTTGILDALKQDLSETSRAIKDFIGQKVDAVLMFKEEHNKEKYLAISQAIFRIQGYYHSLRNLKIRKPILWERGPIFS